MKSFFINFICAFIPSRRKRKEFRNKFKPVQESAPPLVQSQSTAELAKFMSRHLVALALHNETFSEFKGIFAGRDVVLVAAGPSVKDYVPIKNAIHVGVNRAMMLAGVKFNYLFAIDMLGINGFMDEFAAYDCMKFIGDQDLGPGRQIPESYFLGLKNARKYKTDVGLCVDDDIPLEIDSRPLWNSNSVAHQALQFILFTNPRRVYLVGCDCTGFAGGHFVHGGKDRDNEGTCDKDFWLQQNKYMHAGWQKIKDFARLYYPDTEIISINPVGLCGMFNDLTQGK